MAYAATDAPLINHSEGEREDALPDPCILCRASVKLCVESIGVSLLDSTHRASLRRPIVIRF